ncbi:hypothetical protein BV20DRAFT_738644 [Pilatotrama ljubarskyi]|nr:hypothetical protein BV20DRAFT_738644 [Pilatotrama ljubarskyi]
MLPDCLSVTHPYVQAYIECAAAFLVQAEVNTHPDRTCTNTAWHELTDFAHCTTWWRVEYGGIAHPESVAHALNVHPDMSLDDARRVFVLAALAVYSFPKHPAHWAFWARNSRRRVLQLVHEVVCEKPQRIVVPSEVAWLDVEYNYIGLCNYQKPWLPMTPRPTTVHAPEAPPKKPVKTRTVPRRGATRAKPSQALAEAEVQPEGGKRKRGAQMEEHGSVAEPARKRPKRGVATVEEPRVEKRAETARATRKGKAAQGDQPNVPEVPAEGAQSKPSQARKGRSKARPDAKAKKTPAAPPIIRIDPPSEADMSVDVEVVEPGDHLSKIPTQLGTTRKARSRVSRTLRKVAAVSPSSSPLSEPPSTPVRGPLAEDFSSPTPTRPAGRCLHRRTFSAARSDTSEVSTSLSLTTTAVASDPGEEEQ